HAAGLFDTSGKLLRIAEDVGRHNAVDKVLGAELAARHVPLLDRVLFVSGRTSFEIVQKAVMGGVPIVAGVSAPSSLAIELASQAGVTLLGSCEGGRSTSTRTRGELRYKVRATAAGKFRHLGDPPAIRRFGRRIRLVKAWSKLPNRERGLLG